MRAALLLVLIFYIAIADAQKKKKSGVRRRWKDLVSRIADKASGISSGIAALLAVPLSQSIEPTEEKPTGELTEVKPTEGLTEEEQTTSSGRIMLTPAFLLGASLLVAF